MAASSENLKVEVEPLEEAGASPLHPRRRRGLKTVVLAFALLAVACIAAYLIYGWVEDARFGDPFAAAGRAGIPLSYDDPSFDKWGVLRSPSPYENAAVFYEQAFPLLPDRFKSLIPFTTTQLPKDPREPLPPEVLQASKAYLEPLGEVFDLLHRGAQPPECYFSIKWEGIATLWPHLTRSRSAVRLLCLKACIAAEEGRPGEAVEAVCDSFALSRGLYKEPALVSSLVGMAVDSISRSAAERLLSRLQLSNEDLLTLQTVLADAADRVSVRTTLTGEVAMLQDIFNSIQAGEDPYALTGFGGGPPALAGRKALLLLMRVSGYVQANRKKCLRETLKLIEIAGNPTPETLSDAFWADWNDRVSSKRHALAAIFLPGLGQSIRTCATARAKLRAAAASCAALRYRNDNGKWPESLEALVPAYLDKVPLDPYTGKPLIYAFEDNAMIIYSAGFNQVDDGGAPYLSTKPGEGPAQTTQNADDAGVQVWK